MDLATIQELTDGGKLNWIADNAVRGEHEEVQLAYLSHIDGYNLEYNVDTGLLTVKLGEDVIDSSNKVAGLVSSVESLISAKQAEVEAAVEVKPEVIDVEVEKVKFAEAVTAYAVRMTAVEEEKIREELEDGVATEA